MTEIEIFAQLGQLGIGTLIVIGGIFLLRHFITAWRDNAKELNNITKLRTENERLEREIARQRDIELSLLIRDLGAKNEAVAKILDTVSDKLTDENSKAIEATKNAESHVSAKLDTQHSILTTHTQGITAITAKLDELMALFVEYSNRHSKELETNINANVREIVSLLQVQLNEFQNRLVSERLKVYEEFKRGFSDIPTVDVSVINANAPERASGGNGHAPESTDVK